MKIVWVFGKDRKFSYFRKLYNWLQTYQSKNSKTTLQLANKTESDVNLYVENFLVLLSEQRKIMTSICIFLWKKCLICLKQ